MEVEDTGYDDIKPEVLQISESDNYSISNLEEIAKGQEVKPEIHPEIVPPPKEPFKKPSNKPRRHKKRRAKSQQWSRPKGFSKYIHKYNDLEVQDSNQSTSNTLQENAIVIEEVDIKPGSCIITPLSIPTTNYTDQEQQPEKPPPPKLLMDRASVERRLGWKLKKLKDHQSIIKTRSQAETIVSKVYKCIQGCPNGTREYASQARLRQHIVKFHPNELSMYQKVKASKTGLEGAHNCKFCDWIGFSPTKFVNHMKQSHPEIESMIDVELLKVNAIKLARKEYKIASEIGELYGVKSNGIDNKKRYICYEGGCQEKLRNLGQLNWHILNEHQLKGQAVSNPIPYWKCGVEGCLQLSLNAKGIISHTRSIHGAQKMHTHKPIHIIPEPSTIPTFEKIKVEINGQDQLPAIPGPSISMYLAPEIDPFLGISQQDPLTLKIPKIYKCREQDCNTPLESPVAYQRHLLDAHRRSFNNDDDAYYKRQRLHLQKTGYVYQCQSCTWFTHFPEELESHMKSAHQINLSLLTLEELTTYFQNCQKTVPRSLKKLKGEQYTCPQPGCRFKKKWFRGKMELQLHIVNKHQLRGQRVENPIPFWKCRSCTYRTLAKYGMKAHIKKSHKVEFAGKEEGWKHFCKKALEPVKTKAKKPYPKRKTIDPIFKCSEAGCRMQFKRKMDLSLHNINDHALKGEELLNPVPYWSCQASNCTHFALSKSSMSFHIKSKHRGQDIPLICSIPNSGSSERIGCPINGSNTPIKEPPSSRNEETPNFKCEMEFEDVEPAQEEETLKINCLICGVGFGIFSQLELHLDNCHCGLTMINEGFNKIGYFCQIRDCDFRHPIFSSTEELKKHHRMIHFNALAL